MVNFGLRSWVLGLREYFFICDNLRVSTVNQLKGGVGKTLESLNPGILESSKAYIAILSYYNRGRLYV